MTIPGGIEELKTKYWVTRTTVLQSPVHVYTLLVATGGFPPLRICR